MSVRHVKVPAYSERNIELYAVLPVVKPDTTLWAAQPELLASGLIIARTLLPERAIEQAVRVLSPTAQNIRLRRGTLCNLEPVTLYGDSDGGLTETAAMCKSR